MLLDARSCGKCLTLSFSATLPVCAPEGFSWAICVPLLWSRPFKMGIPGTESRGQCLVPRGRNKGAGRLSIAPRGFEFGAVRIFMLTQPPGAVMLLVRGPHFKNRYFRHGREKSPKSVTCRARRVGRDDFIQKLIGFSRTSGSWRRASA